MSQIPTAEETLRNYNAQVHDSDWRTLVAMREFAKLHVQAALKEACLQGSICESRNIWEVTEEEIMSAYPLENIK